MTKRIKISAALVVLLAAIVGIIVFGLTRSSAAQSSKRIKVTMWESMTGAAGDELKKIVADYNKSQDKYEVVPEYEGAYALSMSKFKNTIGSNASPDLIQVEAGAGATMVGLNDYVSVQKFIDQDDWDTSQLYSNVKNAYSVNGELLSMPSNTSTAMLYYDKSLFKKYGVADLPESPTYSEVAEAAYKLTQNSHGKVKGISVQIYAWLAEELVANQQVSLVNNGNGRTAVATKATLNTPAMRAVFQWINKMIKNGSFMNYGSGSGAQTNQLAGFLAQKIGMYMQSSASIGNLQKSATFKYGVCFMPHADGTTANGVAAGGASYWITKDAGTQQQQGAWDFLKYSMQASVQAEWQVKTGYIANNTASPKVSVLKKAIKANPELAVPTKQLMTAKKNDATAGPFFVDLSETGDYLAVAMQQIYGGKNINKALAAAEKSANAAIKLTNATNYDLLNFNKKKVSSQ